jgi:hypothetical protein
MTTNRHRRHVAGRTGGLREITQRNNTPNLLIGSTTFKLGERGNSGLARTTSCHAETPILLLRAAGRNLARISIVVLMVAVVTGKYRSIRYGAIKVVGSFK